MVQAGRKAVELAKSALLYEKAWHRRSLERSAHPSQTKDGVSVIRTKKLTPFTRVIECIVGLHPESIGHRLARVYLRRR